MNNEDVKFLRNLLYIEDNHSIIEEIKNIKNPMFLHILSANYNWDNGLNIPKAILANEKCDFGTGLLLFYHADGYRLLESKDTIFDSTLRDWNEFVIHLYTRLLDDEFPTRSISFTPPLTKVQIFKLKKLNPSIPNVLLVKSPGDELEIPVL